MNIQAKLNLIHDSANTKTPISAEECFQSYLRAAVGIVNVSNLDAIQLIDHRMSFSDHVNQLFNEYMKRPDRAEARAA